MTEDASLRVRKRLQKTRRTPSLVTDADVEVIVGGLESDDLDHERRTELLDALAVLVDEQPGLIASVLDRLLANDHPEVRSRSLSFVADLAAEQPDGEVPGSEKLVTGLHADELSVIEAALDALSSAVANDPGAFSDAMPTVVDAVMQRPAAFSTRTIEGDETLLDCAAAALSEVAEHTPDSTVADVLVQLFKMTRRQNPSIGRQPSQSGPETPRPEPIVLYGAIGAAAPEIAVQPFERDERPDVAAVATGPAPELRTAAIEAIEAITTADPDWTQGIPIIVDRLDDDDRDVRETAAQALAAIAEADATALVDHVDDLTTATYDPDETVRDAVEMTLVMIAEAAPETLADRIAVFVGMLESDSASRTEDEIQRRARYGLHGLTCIGQEDPSALESHADVVVACLDEETSGGLLEKAVQAVEVLPKRTLDVPQVVGELASIVDSDHLTGVRSQAATTLASFAEHDPDAFEQYISWLGSTMYGSGSVVTNPDETAVRVGAGETLQRIATVEPELLSKFKERLVRVTLDDYEDPRVLAIALRVAVTYLLEHPDESVRSFDLWTELFDIDDPRVQAATADIVGDIAEANSVYLGGNHDELVDEGVVELARAGSPDVRERAYVALERIASAPSMVPMDVLLEGLDAGEDSVRVAASDALTTRVERDPRTLTDGSDVAEVAAALDDAVPEVRMNAFDVLNEVKPRDPKAIVDQLPSVLSVLEYPSERWRDEAGKILQYVAREAPTATLEYRDDVVDYLGHEASDVREVAAYMLGSLGHEHPPYARDWIPVLLALLDDDTVSVRIAAIDALGRIADAVSTGSIDAYDEGIGLFGEGARDIANRAVDSEYPQERKVALEALVSLRAVDQRVRIERLADSDPFDFVERTARQALEALPEQPVQTSLDSLSVPAASLTDQRGIDPAAVPTASVGPNGRVVDHEAVLAYDQFDPYEPATILEGDSSDEEADDEDAGDGTRVELGEHGTTGDSPEPAGQEGEERLSVALETDEIDGADPGSLALSFYNEAEFDRTVDAVVSLDGIVLTSGDRSIESFARKLMVDAGESASVSFDPITVSDDAETATVRVRDSITETELLEAELPIVGQAVDDSNDDASDDDATTTDAVADAGRDQVADETVPVEDAPETVDGTTTATDDDPAATDDDPATTDGISANETRGAFARAQTTPKWLESGPETIPEPPSLSLDFDVFSLDDRLGHGGYATVYRDVVTVDDRTVPVAVKLPRFHRDGTISREEIERLLGEAKRWAAVDDHDHVVNVLDWGTDASVPWIAMEYMDGGSLADRIGDISVAEGLYIADCLAGSLHHAHLEAGQTAHLDITPANVLFRSVDDGWDVPKLADWGLSKQLRELSSSVDGVTPTYAAPEQLSSGESVNYRADIYQLGAVLYELFTGEQPFDDAVDVVRYHEHGEELPAPTTVDPALPSELDAILTRAMAPEKSTRHNTADKLRSALRSINLD